MAALNGQSEVASLLLTHEADIEAADKVMIEKGILRGYNGGIAEGGCRG